MAELNWGLLQTPDFFGNALKANALGQQQAAQDTKQNALKMYATDPNAAVSQLMGVDPEAAASLSKLHQGDVTAQARAKAAQQIAAGDLNGARQTGIGAGADDLVTYVDKLDDQGRQHAAVTAYMLKKAPAEQRGALQAKLAGAVTDPQLKASLSAGPLSDDVLDEIIGQGLGVKGVIEQAKADRTPLQLDPEKSIYMPDPVLGGAQTQAGGGPQAPQPGAGTMTASAPAQPTADTVWAAMKHREVANGDGNAVSPQGAIGSTQMLPATAEGMARKLGVAWRPDLMRGNTPNALAYQDKLGRAYFDEGVAKYGGDLAKGASYYHGGPDESIWGPKTQAYAAAVTGGGHMDGGAAGDTIAPPPQSAPSIPGYHLVQQGQPKAGKEPGAGKWGVYVDPQTNTSYRYNPETHEATTLDGQAYTPAGLAKLNGGGQPRSAAALAAQRYIQEHPNASAEDVSQFNANLNKERSATTAFGTGKQGQTINSMNVSIDHLSTLQDLSTALGNGNIQALNSVRQKWNTQTGNSAPTNFAAAKQIVGDEIVKGIVGSGGGVADREKAQAAISAASSPQQLADVISTYKRLLAGQLNGLRLQYKTTTGRGDFEDKLLPETRVELEKLSPPAAPAATAGWSVKRVR